MRKKIGIKRGVGILVVAFSCMASPALGATDYSAMTNEELAQMRGTMRDAPEEDHDAFRNEWQERVNNMSQEERQNSVGRPANAIQDGSGNQYRQRNGGNYRNGSGGGRR